MQRVVASVQLALLFAVPARGGIFDPSMLKNEGSEGSEGKSLIIFNVRSPVGKASVAKNISSCKDDPTWLDPDGDGCAAYAEAIKEGHIRQKVACGVELPRVEDIIMSGDPQGAALNCRATCGTCPAAEPETASALAPEPETELPSSEGDGHVDAMGMPCEDDPEWTDADGDGCDMYAKYINAGRLTQAMACGFEITEGWTVLESGDPNSAAQNCRATCGTCDSDNLPQESMLNIARSIVDESPQYDQAMASSDSNEVPEVPCVDDANWADMDGHSCADYAEAIASGEVKEEEACARAFMREIASGNPDQAAKHCPVACRNCALRERDFRDADTGMKDMIRLLIEEESEDILQFADMEELEEEDAPAVTTTTTTPLRLHEYKAEVPANSTWAVYWAPEEDEESMELSHMDLVKMASGMPQQSSFKENLIV